MEFDSVDGIGKINPCKRSSCKGWYDALKITSQLLPEIITGELLNLVAIFVKNRCEAKPPSGGVLYPSRGYYHFALTLPLHFLYKSPLFGYNPSMAQTNPLTFLQEVRTELAKVHWPTKDETIKLTIVVIVISTALGVFIGSIDFVLVKLTELLLKR